MEKESGKVVLLLMLVMPFEVVLAKNERVPSRVRIPLPPKALLMIPACRAAGQIKESPRYTGACIEGSSEPPITKLR